MGAILWLASYPKSGNTWTRIFLHNLMINPEKPLSINELNKLSTGDSSWTYYKQFTDKESPEEVTIEELAAIRPKIHRYLTGMHPDTVFVKTHNMLADLAGVPLISMEVTAGAIYIVRNPLDVVPSFANHMGTDIEGSIAAMGRSLSLSMGSDKQVTQLFGSWSEHVRSWTGQPHPQIHVMRYEDMLENSMETFGKLANFMGLNPPEERLVKAIEFSSFKELKRQEAETGFAERSEKAETFFRAGKREQWREVLSDEQIKQVIEDHREQMERFDYIPEDYK